MPQLTFKSGSDALNYVEKFFGHEVVTINKTYYGVVQFIDKSGSPDVFMLEIVALKKIFFSSKVGIKALKKSFFPYKAERVIVSATKHPELYTNIKEGDLVVWGCIEEKTDFSVGVIVDKCELKMDEKNTGFVISDKELPRVKPAPQNHQKKRFEVYIDDNFHYMDESERYLNGKYESEEEAFSVCRKIVDDYLLNAYKPEMTAKQLYESYVSHGEDPFIKGGSFCAWSYAEKRSIEIVEENNRTSKNNISVNKGLSFWKYELDHKYGLLLPESEIIEDENRLYFCQTNRKKLCVSWDKKKETWEVNLDRSLLEGLSFSTPKRFEQVVFGKDVNNEGYFRKQLLIEFLLEGLGAGEIKTLTKEVDNAAKIELSVEAKTWNEMLIGNPVGVEGGICKYFEQTNTSERILNFSMLCNNWEVNIEFLLGDYEEYEQHTFRIKDFGGYYN
jgi:hypothetical protein